MSKPKYIDAEAFFKVINTLPYKETSYPDASAYNGAISDVADLLIHFPAADVVEVCRCKDCKHSEEFIYPEGLEIMVCWEGGADREVNRNGFCEKGERKDG